MIFLRHIMNNNNKKNGGFYAEMVVQISRLSEIISNQTPQLR